LGQRLLALKNESFGLWVRELGSLLKSTCPAGCAFSAEHGEHHEWQGIARCQAGWSSGSAAIGWGCRCLAGISGGRKPSTSRCRRSVLRRGWEHQCHVVASGGRYRLLGRLERRRRFDGRVPHICGTVELHVEHIFAGDISLRYDGLPGLGCNSRRRWGRSLEQSGLRLHEGGWCAVGVVGVVAKFDAAVCVVVVGCAVGFGCACVVDLSG
jgi:hypothetical protein